MMEVQGASMDVRGDSLKISENIKVVEGSYKAERSRCTVILEAPTRDELEAPGVREFAQKYVREKGFPVYGVSDVQGPYPVDDKGRTGAVLMHGVSQIVGQRLVVILSAGPNTM